MKATEIFKYKGTDICFQAEGESVLINATEMAKVFGKLPGDWGRLKSTTDFLTELSGVKGIPITGLVTVKQGGVIQGTWMHEDVALEFARWLSSSFAIWCSELIKELIKHGATAINPEDLLNPDFIINLATELKKERAEKERLKIQSDIQTKELQQAAPKVEYYEKVLQAEGLIPTNVVAKEMGMSAVTLNRILHQKNVIYRSGMTWVLFHQYQNKGYTGTKTFNYMDSFGKEKTSIQTYWTEKGRRFIHGLVNKDVLV